MGIVQPKQVQVQVKQETVKDLFEIAKKNGVSVVNVVQERRQNID